MTKILANGFEFRLDERDIVNPDDMIPAGEYNPHNVRLWLLHEPGYVFCAVFASSLQDALDIAADHNELQRFMVDPDSPTDIEDYGPNVYDNESLAFLGNASEPFDIETLGYVEIPAPTMSITALYGDTVQALSYHV